MSIQPVPDEAVLLYDRAVVLADLHIGIEFSFRESGFVVPKQTENMLTRLMDIVKRKNAERIVIVGDLKHKIKSVSPQERVEVPAFFERLLDVVNEIHLVPGNHDANILSVLPKEIRAHDPPGVRIGDVGFTHGFGWPSEEAMSGKVLCMGHVHPAVLFVDRLGLRMSKRCWLRAGFTNGGERYEKVPDELIVIPAFNEFCGGYAVNSPRRRPIGPLLRSDLVDLDEARIYLLNGIELGKLRDLSIPAEEKK